LSSVLENKSLPGGARKSAGVPSLNFFRSLEGLNPQVVYRRATSGEEFEGQASSYKRQNTKRDIYHGYRTASSMPVNWAVSRPNPQLTRCNKICAEESLHVLTWRSLPCALPGRSIGDWA